MVCTISTTVLIGSEEFGAYNGVNTSLTRESGLGGWMSSIGVQVRHVDLVRV